MNRSIIAGAAVICGLTLAVPTIAQAADEQPRAGQTMLAQSSMTPGMQGGMHDRDDMTGRRGGMGQMMHHRMMQMSPQQRCEERLARRAGRVAYTATKLKLTAEQRPLWDRLSAAMQATQEREQQLCATLQAGPGTILDRLNRREQFLTTRLQAVQQVRPVVEQLYRTLTPEQKAIIDNPARRG